MKIPPQKIQDNKDRMLPLTYFKMCNRHFHRAPRWCVMLEQSGTYSYSSPSVPAFTGMHKMQMWRQLTVATGWYIMKFGYLRLPVTHHQKSTFPSPPNSAAHGEEAVQWPFPSSYLPTLVSTVKPITQQWPRTNWWLARKSQLKSNGILPAPLPVGPNLSLLWSGSFCPALVFFLLPPGATPHTKF